MKKNREALLSLGVQLGPNIREEHFEGRNYSVGSANQMNKLSLVGMQHLFSGIPTKDCSILRPCHTIAYRTSVYQRMKNITHTLVYADLRQGYVRHRLYTCQARSHTVAHGETETFFKHA